MSKHDQVQSVIGTAGAILGLVHALIAVTDRLMALAGVPRAEIEATLGEARARAEDSGRRLDAALDGD